MENINKTRQPYNQNLYKIYDISLIKLITYNLFINFIKNNFFRI